MALPRAPDEVGELLEIVFRPLGLPVAALGAEQPVVVMGHEHRLGAAFALAVEDFAEVGIVGEPGGDVGQRHGLELLDEGLGRHAGAGLEVARGGFAQVAFLALELGDELVAHQRTLCVARHLHELARQLGEGDGRVDHHGLHGGQALQGFVDLHRVEDAEGLLADLVAQARGAAEHLVEQDAAVDPAQEHEVADLGHVDAGGEQVHRDRDVRVGARSCSGGSVAAACRRRR